MKTILKIVLSIVKKRIGKFNLKEKRRHKLKDVITNCNNVRRFKISTNAVFFAEMIIAILFCLTITMFHSMIFLPIMTKLENILRN